MFIRCDHSVAISSSAASLVFFFTVASLCVCVCDSIPRSAQWRPTRTACSRFSTTCSSVAMSRRGETTIAAVATPHQHRHTKGAWPHARFCPARWRAWRATTCATFAPHPSQTRACKCRQASVCFSISSPLFFPLCLSFCCLALFTPTPTPSVATANDGGAVMCILLVCVFLVSSILFRSSAWQRHGRHRPR